MNKPVANPRAYIAGTSADLEGTLRKGLEFVDWETLVPKGSRVFIKPNFTYPHHKEGITTTPAVLEKLLDIVSTRAGTITVGESDGGNHSFTADEAFRGHDMPRICEKFGVKLVNLSSLPSRVVEEPVAGKKVKVRLPELLLNDVDCFISVPVLKVHTMTSITLSIKNLWGCHPDTMRCLEHQDLSWKLSLITKSVRPRLVVIDATYGLDGHGPMFGEAKKLDMLIVGDNPVATDALGAALMGMPLSRVEHIRIAEKAGLGTTDLNALILNEKWQKYRMQFTYKRTMVDWLSRLLFVSDALARFVLASPVTPLIYKVATKFRNSSERQVAGEIGNREKPPNPR
jgi:uncharacterized protein (DUF362 family)